MLTLKLLKTKILAKEAQSIKRIISKCTLISNCTLKLRMHIRIIFNCKPKLIGSNPRRLYKLSMVGIKVSKDQLKRVANISKLNRARQTLAEAKIEK